MTKEKQIEEMAFDLCLIDRCKHLPQEECHNTTCAHCEAEALYNAGYRKQSEGEWKQTTEPLGCHDVDCVECSACGESWVLDEDFDYDVVKDFWNYCPACGAKMKGGAE
jgi:hypothetical protein